MLEQDVDTWCRTVDALVADGVDPDTAVADADLLLLREGLQLSLDRD